MMTLKYIQYMSWCLEIFICFGNIFVMQRKERRALHAQKETEFLRLKRSRLGIDDFDSLKVIGRGAFGEVSVKTSVNEYEEYWKE